MKKISFFVHIPKTAGTSFRLELQKNESVKMLYDYGDISPKSSIDLISIAPGELSQDNLIFDDDKFNFICGHVPYGKYSHFITVENVFSIVRNPVERVVSAYQHVRRNDNYSGSFEKFSSSKIQQNKQSKVLNGLKTDNDVLVGLTSHYQYFVELLSQKTGLEVGRVGANRAPKKDVKERLNLSVESILKAYQLNKKDLDNFFLRVDRFAEMVRAAGYNTAPVEGLRWGCRIHKEQHLVGWVSRDEKDCYFIVIEVNGQRRAVIGIDQYREEIFKKGLSKSPMCGFNYPLSLLGTVPGDTLTLSFLGSEIKKSLVVK